MDIPDLIKTITTVAIAVIGWIVAHHFSSKRDRRLKRRELITAHLIKSYLTFTNDISHRPVTAETDKKLEDTISEIQLFGSAEQVRLVKQLTDDIVKGGDFDVDELVNSLRNDLRNELGLSAIKGNVRWLRQNRKK